MPTPASVLATAGALALIPLAVVPAAQADGLGGISGWQPPTPVCGEANIVPLLVANYTNEVQTGSITIGGDLTEQVVVDPYQGANCPQRDGTGRWEQNGSTYSQNFTIQPGTVGTYTISLGGVDENLIGTSHTFSIGGDPNGASDAQWYDFELYLNADESFHYLGSYYSGTGGTDTTNTQNGFNILSCNPVVPASGDNVTVTGPIASPYSSGNAPGPGWGSGAAICLGWLPEGEMVTDQAVIVPSEMALVSSITAAQYNASLNTVGLVAAVGESVTGVEVVGTNGQATTLGNTPGSPDGFWYQSGNSVYIEGIPAYQTTQVVLANSTSASASLVEVPTPAAAATTTINVPATAAALQVTAFGSGQSWLQDVGASVVGSSGLDAQVNVSFAVDLTELAQQVAPGAMGQSANLWLTGLTGPEGPISSSGIGESYGQIWELPAGEPLNPTNFTVSVPAASNQQALTAGDYLTGDYVATFALAPGSQPSPTSEDPSFTITLQVAAPTG